MRDSVRSVWEAIIFGLILSVVILFLFLKDWGSTLVAIVVIPVTVLVTLLAMRLLDMTLQPDDPGRHRVGHRPGDR